MAEERRGAEEEVEGVRGALGLELDSCRADAAVEAELAQTQIREGEAARVLLLAELRSAERDFTEMREMVEATSQEAARVRPPGQTTDPPQLASSQRLASVDITNHKTHLSGHQTTDPPELASSLRFASAGIEPDAHGSPRSPSASSRRF